MSIPRFGVGQAVRRKEDDKLLRGQGCFVADHSPEGVLQAFVMRSPHAHAPFRLTNVDAVRTLPGIRLVLTADDFRGMGPLPCRGLIPGANMKVPENPVLPTDEVRHVGDAVAFLVAETLDE